MLPSDPSPYQELLDEFLQRPNPNTERHYRDSLKDFSAFCKVASIETAIRRLLQSEFPKANRLVTSYRDEMEGKRNKVGKLKSGRGLSPNAINLRISVLRNLVKKAHRHGLVRWQLDIANLPAENVRPTSGPGLDVLNRMLESARAQAGPKGRRDYAILRLAGELGLRRKELVALDLDDFDPEDLTLCVRGKGRREKAILNCSERSGEALNLWIAVRPTPRTERPLFTNLIPGRPTRLSGTAIYEIVRMLGRLALPPGSRKVVRPHGIRHTAITEAVRNSRELGLAREEVQKFSRHRDFRMVARYLDADDQAQKKFATKAGSRLV